MYKKRWYDGLHDIYEGKNEFEIKFGCFGGDGGNGNGSKSPTPPSDPTPDTGFRGEQSAAAKAAADAAKAAAQAEIEANLAGKAQAAQDIQGKVADAVAASTGKIGPVDVGGPKGLSISTPAEQLATTTTTRTPQEIADSVSLAGLSTGKVSAPTTPVNDLTTAVSLPGTTVAPAVQNQLGLAPYDQDYVSPYATGPLADAFTSKVTPGTQTKGVNLGRATLSGYTPNPNAPLGTLQGGLKATFSYAKGGVVQQGIGSIFPYPRRR